MSLRDIPGDADHVAIAGAIVAMGRGLRLIAGGVETEEQRAFLSGLGCSLMQGSLFGRPLPVDEATAWLADSG